MIFLKSIIKLSVYYSKWYHFLCSDKNSIRRKIQTISRHIFKLWALYIHGPWKRGTNGPSLNPAFISGTKIYRFKTKFVMPPKPEKKDPNSMLAKFTAYKLRTVGNDE